MSHLPPEALSHIVARLRRAQVEIVDASSEATRARRDRVCDLAIEAMLAAALAVSRAASAVDLLLIDADDALRDGDEGGGER